MGISPHMRRWFLDHTSGLNAIIPTVVAPSLDAIVTQLAASDMGGINAWSVQFPEPVDIVLEFGIAGPPLQGSWTSKSIRRAALPMGGTARTIAAGDCHGLVVDFGQGGINTQTQIVDVESYGRLVIPHCTKVACRAYAAIAGAESLTVAVRPALSDERSVARVSLVPLTFVVAAPLVIQSNFGPMVRRARVEMWGVNGIANLLAFEFLDSGGNRITSHIGPQTALLVPGGSAMNQSEYWEGPLPPGYRQMRFSNNGAATTCGASVVGEVE